MNNTWIKHYHSLLLIRFFRWLEVFSEIATINDVINIGKIAENVIWKQISWCFHQNREVERTNLCPALSAKNAHIFTITFLKRTTVSLHITIFQTKYFSISTTKATKHNNNIVCSVPTLAFSCSLLCKMCEFNNALYCHPTTRFSCFLFCLLFDFVFWLPL